MLTSIKRRSFTARELMRVAARFGIKVARGLPPRSGTAMAKSQKKSNKEVRKPKAEKAPKANASNPTSKGQPVAMVNIKG
ncbi:MAG: hypothetical protein ACJASD_001327 [Sphingomonas echinoides]|jgi:hypothetical protein